MNTSINIDNIARLYAMSFMCRFLFFFFFFPDRTFLPLFFYYFLYFSWYSKYFSFKMKINESSIKIR